MEIERPTTLLKPLKVPSKTLMGPGPSNCSPRVLQALSHPVLSHLDQDCCQIMDEVKDGIRYVFQTRNTLTLAISASGHGGMEATMCNLLEPGDKAMVAVNGLWGQRAANIAQRYGANVVTLQAELGQGFSLIQIENAFIIHRPQLFFIVQGESSTGVYQNLEGIGDICRRYNCLFAVDTVASLGGVPFFADDWNVDAVYTCSQKVLGAPAGLTPISFSRRAQERIFKRRTQVKSFYWDMIVLGVYWNCFDERRIYHHTLSSQLLYGLREGLAMIVDEGLENVIKRHQNCAKLLHDGLVELNFEFFVNDECKRLPTVTTLKIPHDIKWQDIIQYCKDNYQIEINGGLGPTENKVIRIGLMGYNATRYNVETVLKVLREALQYAMEKKRCKL